MSFLAWIALGLLAGFLGSKTVNNKGEGYARYHTLGCIVGVEVRGWLFNTFGASGPRNNLYMLVTVIGSWSSSFVYDAMRRVI